MNKFWSVLKLFTGIILFGLFIWNSLNVFVNFAAEKKVTSSNDVSFDHLPPPAIFICREISFTDPKRNMSTLEDFHSNTLDLQYMIWHSWDYMNSSAPDPNSTIFRVEDVYSYSRGRCTTFQWSVEVDRKYISRINNSRNIPLVKRVEYNLIWELI